MPKISPFDEATDPKAWINYATVALGELPEGQRILAAIRCFKGNRIGWISSFEELPRTWRDFVTTFKTHFINNGENISETVRLLRKARELKQWNQEEFVSLKLLARQAGMSEYEAIKSIAAELNPNLAPRRSPWKEGATVAQSSLAQFSFMNFILLMDCTRKTNQYNMPLLLISSVGRFEAITSSRVD